MAFGRWQGQKQSYVTHAWNWKFAKHRRKRKPGCTLCNSSSYASSGNSTCKQSKSCLGKALLIPKGNSAGGLCMNTTYYSLCWWQWYVMHSCKGRESQAAHCAIVAAMQCSLRQLHLQAVKVMLGQSTLDSKGEQCRWPMHEYNILQSLLVAVVCNATAAATTELAWSKYIDFIHKFKGKF